MFPLNAKYAAREIPTSRCRSTRIGNRRPWLSQRMSLNFSISRLASGGRSRVLDFLERNLSIVPRVREDTVGRAAPRVRPQELFHAECVGVQQAHGSGGNCSAETPWLGDFRGRGQHMSLPRSRGARRSQQLHSTRTRHTGFDYGGSRD